MMERRVKERLIGATVLVALIVLIVPEMLSGPSPRSAQPLTAGLPALNRSVSLDLMTHTATSEPDLAEGASTVSPPPAGGGASGAAPDGASAASSAAAGDAASENAPPNHDAPSPPTVTTLQAQEPAGGAAGGGGVPPGSTLETAPSGPKSGMSGSASSQAHRGWWVQLGSFASRSNAERLMHQLQARGGSSLYVSASGSGSSLRFRVRMGPLADRGAAERAAGKLRAGGHPSTVVAPNS